MEENPDGSVLAVFKALHNHDCQQQYLLHYLNPLDICTTLSDIVDTKLLAGVTDLTNIHSSMLKEVGEGITGMYKVGDMLHASTLRW